MTGCMAFNAFNALSMTPASLFRIVESSCGTLLIDEVEKLNKKDESDIRTLLLAGYKKGAEVPRVEEKKNSQGKSFEIPCYSTYSPKMLANIAGVEDVLEDRCVSVILTRGKDKKKMNKEVNTNSDEWPNIRDVLYCSMMFNARQVESRNNEIGTYIDKFYEDRKKIFDAIFDDSEETIQADIRESQSTLGSGKITKTKKEPVDAKELIDSTVKGRSFELWRPIFTLASLISDELLEIIFMNAIKHEKMRREEDITETLDSILVELLLQIVTGDNFYRVKDIAQKLKEMNPEDEKWLNTRWVSRAMKRLGLVKEKKRHSSGVMIKLCMKDIKSIAEKLGITVIEPVDILKKSSEKVSQNQRVLEKITELDDAGNKNIDERELIKMLEEEGVNNIETKLAYLMNTGYIYRPTPNTIRRV